MPSRAGSSPRTLAEELRSRDDTALAALLRARPDLAVPLPASTTALATRATTRASVQRALDALDAPALQVAEVLAALPSPVTAAAVSRAWGAKASPQLAVLREQALLWGGDRRLQVVTAVRDVLGPHPAGLGPPLAEALGRRSPQRLAELLEDLGLPGAGDPDRALAALAAHLGDPEAVAALLAAAPEGARTVLERLTWGPPVGAVAQAERSVRAATSTGPVDWLLAHGLLAVAGAGTVVLPREVGLVLRGGRVHREPATAPPPLPLREQPPARVAATAAGAAVEAVRLVEALGQLWSEAPAPVLRAGGLGVRELKRVALALEVDELTTALVVELARTAGLVADDQEVEPRWVPTPRFDGWVEEPVEERWVRLASAWLPSTRVAALVGTRDAKGAARNALGPDVDRAAAVQVRQRVLAELAQLPADAATEQAVLVERMRFAAPRRASRLREELVGWTLREAAWLGVTGAGALSPGGRALVAGDEEAAAAALATALPAPVRQVLLQADLTAVAPGPLEPEPARRLAQLATVESRGGATVYRFDASSVRRALDAGSTADEALRFLAEVSATGVPQPLEYLVRDVARRYGRVRVGSAGAYLRAEDESVLTELLSERRCASLGLRRLAPTVLAAAAEPDRVLAVLREVGIAPAAEGPDGELVLRRATAHRSGTRQLPRPLPSEVPAPTAALLDAAVRALRAGDEDAVAEERRRASTAQAPPLPAMDPAVSLAVLRDAAARRRAVWLGYADATGQTARRLVEPLSVEGGRVTALDRTDPAGAQEVRTYSVHRVTGVAVHDG
ncbi:XPB/Ssl2-like helicase family protein [Kineococcus xinjiangensis]|uniref:XPB/Ssl2-like helicase family protein n=1 Tax=Kineococcus xinjiangensis TaxID=512762 RepID=A0A2S6IT06_9ACTN|nr:helicase-associated domain-containing protein [Kineococcus xinjiangensis]PPK97379.1 XPB/Ssl2-like helicase family protein [Kineococcus xinjiangensis]